MAYGVNGAACWRRKRGEDVGFCHLLHACFFRRKHSTFDFMNL
jgi:hypothetical protein